MITLRRANGDDAQTLAVLAQSVHELHVAAVPHHFKPVDSEPFADWYRALLARDDVRAWIAFSGDVPVGYAVAIAYSRPENLLALARSYSELDQIGVLPSFRMKGVARALVEMVLEDARARGIRDVELSSWSFNQDAHKAFAALGFAPKVVRFARPSD